MIGHSRSRLSTSDGCRPEVIVRCSTVTHVDVDRELVVDLSQAVGRYVDWDSSPLTAVQRSGMFHALAAVIGGPPDALFATEHLEDGTPVDPVAYTIHWVRHGRFGTFEVARPTASDASAPRPSGWVRPLSDIERVDFEVVLESRQFNASELWAKLKVVLHWRGADNVTTELDATGPMKEHARPALERLIELATAGG